MRKKSTMADAQVENKSPVERKRPIDFRPITNSDDETVTVMFIYWAHHRVDDDRPVNEREMYFSFPKQKIIEIIDEEGYSSPYSLVNHCKRLDDIYWDIYTNIMNGLINDFKKSSQERDIHQMRMRNS